MSDVPVTPSVFDSFNARNLRPEQVARSFVPSENFDLLCKRGHTLVVGPRGSGKTTLLKMLQCEAIDSWVHDKADSYRKRIEFIGVFVPTDRVWKEQIDVLISEGFSDPQRNMFAKALFGVHVIYKLVEVFNYKCTKDGDQFEFGDNVEVSLIGELVSLWSLDTKIPTFTSLMSALSRRKAKLPELINLERMLGHSGREERLAAHPFLFLDMLQSVSSAVEIFERITGCKTGHWALLFDELELAPGCVVQQLVDAMRGGNERILFKLSLAPYNPNVDIVKDVMSAMPGNDFEFVVLWHAAKNQRARDFSRNLFRAMLREKGLNDVSPEAVLGFSDLPDYGPLITEVIKNDKTAMAYFVRHGINPENLDSIKGEDRAQLLRKIIPVLRVRHEYRRPDGLNRSAAIQKNKGLKRTRKAIPKLYSGADALFDIVEANPRWFIGIIGPLVDIYSETRAKVDSSIQMVEVLKAIHKFRALLKTIPCPPIGNERHSTGVDKALDKIGNYFHEFIVRQDFKPDIPGSFEVTLGLSDPFKASLGAALNAGAIVYVNGPSADVVLDNIDGHRFRLSYLLAPHYKLPLQLFKPIGLNVIFKNDKIASQGIFSFES